MDRRAKRRERREESPRCAALPGAGRPDAVDRVEESHRWDAFANQQDLNLQLSLARCLWRLFSNVDKESGQV